MPECGRITKKERPGHKPEQHRDEDKPPFGKETALLKPFEREGGGSSHPCKQPNQGEGEEPGELSCERFTEEPGEARRSLAVCHASGSSAGPGGSHIPVLTCIRASHTGCRQLPRFPEGTVPLRSHRTIAHEIHSTVFQTEAFEPVVIDDETKNRVVPAPADIGSLACGHHIDGDCPGKGDTKEHHNRYSQVECTFFPGEIRCTKEIDQKDRRDDNKRLDHLDIEADPDKDDRDKEPGEGALPRCFEDSPDRKEQDKDRAGYPWCHFLRLR